MFPKPFNDYHVLAHLVDRFYSGFCFNLIVQLIDSKPLIYDIMGLYSVIVSLIGLLVFIVIFLGISSSID